MQYSQLKMFDACAALDVSALNSDDQRVYDAFHSSYDLILKHASAGNRAILTQWQSYWSGVGPKPLRSDYAPPTEFKGQLSIFSVI